LTYFLGLVETGVPPSRKLIPLLDQVAAALLRLPLLVLKSWRAGVHTGARERASNSASCKQSPHPKPAQGITRLSGVYEWRRIRIPPGQEDREARRYGIARVQWLQTVLRHARSKHRTGRRCVARGGADVLLLDIGPDQSRGRAIVHAAAAAAPLVPRLILSSRKRIFGRRVASTRGARFSREGAPRPGRACRSLRYALNATAAEDSAKASP